MVLNGQYSIPFVLLKAINDPFNYYGNGERGRCNDILIEKATSFM